MRWPSLLSDEFLDAGMKSRARDRPPLIRFVDICGALPRYGLDLPDATSVLSVEKCRQRCRHDRSARVDPISPRSEGTAAHGNEFAHSPLARPLFENAATANPADRHTASPLRPSHDGFGANKTPRRHSVITHRADQVIVSSWGRRHVRRNDLDLSTEIRRPAGGRLLRTGLQYSTDP